MSPSSGVEQVEARLWFLRRVEASAALAAWVELAREAPDGEPLLTRLRDALSPQGLSADWFVEALARVLASPGHGFAVEAARGARVALVTSAEHGELLTEGEQAEVASSAEQWDVVRRAAAMARHFDEGELMGDPASEEVPALIAWATEYERRSVMLPISANPALERREEFLARAALHYDARAAAFREQAGVRPRRIVPSLQRHVDWTFLHRVEGRSFREIAQAAHVELDAVKQAVRRCVRLLGFPAGTSPPRRVAACRRGEGRR